MDRLSCSPYRSILSRGRGREDEIRVAFSRAFGVRDWCRNWGCMSSTSDGETFSSPLAVNRYVCVCERVRERVGEKEERYRQICYQSRGGNSSKRERRALRDKGGSGNYDVLVVCSTTPTHLDAHCPTVLSSCRPSLCVSPHCVAGGRGHGSILCPATPSPLAGDESSMVLSGPSWMYTSR